jgi:hypothetical protein
MADAVNASAAINGQTTGRTNTLRFIAFSFMFSKNWMRPLSAAYLGGDGRPQFSRLRQSMPPELPLCTKRPILQIEKIHQRSCARKRAENIQLNEAESSCGKFLRQ